MARSGQLERMYARIDRIREARQEFIDEFGLPPDEAPELILLWCGMIEKLRTHKLKVRPDRKYAEVFTRDVSRHSSRLDRGEE